MSGTIVSTPSLGASDWSSWITQQGLTDRGYMRVSLTNFSGTAASAIATGSVMEMAGSIYSFTETAISLATATASASVAVYFNVIPSAGGTTCTVEMDSTVPAWRDDYQGFYASAASTTRVIGGCYIGTAATYYSKYLYTGENLVYCRQTGETRPILLKIAEIGEWNMDATAAINVSIAGVVFNRAVSADCLVFSDAQTQLYSLGSVDQAGNLGGLITISNHPYATLSRAASGIFDNAGFDGTASTVPNRGWVYVRMKA